MRKFIIALTFILSGCTSITLFSENDNCITVNEFEVLQALDNGALAYECTLWDGCSVWNQTVFLTKQLNIVYHYFTYLSMILSQKNLRPEKRLRSV